MIIQVSQVMITQYRNGLKGQRPNSSGHALGYGLSGLTGRLC